MFYAFLQEKHPELLKNAEEAGVDANDFEQVYIYNVDSAVRALREIIKNRSSKEPSKIDRIEEFKQRYTKQIQAALKARNELLAKVNSFSEETGVRVVLEWEDTDENFIRLGRAPRGSKMVPGRDLSKLYQYLTANKLPVELRVSPSDKDPYVLGMLQEDGTITSNGETFKRPNDWTFAVYSDAVKRGTRTTTVGSPWKAISIRQNSRGDWRTLDSAWKEMLDKTGEEDTDEEE